jgi:hypothetical protein
MNSVEAAAMTGQERRAHARAVLPFFAASLAWLAAWLLIPGAFAVWGTLLTVYVVSLTSLSLVGAVGGGGGARTRQWQAAFFRTATWFVLSGLLALVYGAGYIVYHAWRTGEELFPM